MKIERQSKRERRGTAHIQDADALMHMAPKEFLDLPHALCPPPQLLLATRAPKVERPKLTQPHRLEHLPAKPPFMGWLLKKGHQGPSHLPQLMLATRDPKVERPKLTQPHRLQHLPAMFLFVERMLKRGHKALPLPKAVDAHPNLALPSPRLHLQPHSLQERQGAAEGVKALRL